MLLIKKALVHHGAHPGKGQSTVPHSLPEKVALCRETASASGEALSSCKLVHTGVVFKDSRDHSNMESVAQSQRRRNLKEQRPERQQLAHSKTSACALRLKTRHAHLLNELRLPSKRATTKGNDVAGTRVSTVGICRRLATKETGKALSRLAVRWARNHSKILIERHEMDERRASRGVVNNRSSGL
jgi:hypothetical protein